MLEQRRFACSSHAANEQQVALRQQALLDLQDVEVATDEAVLRLGRRILLFGQFSLVVGAALLRGEVARLELHRLVLVDDGQQPVFQVNTLVEVGAALFVVIEFCAGVTDGDLEVFVVKQLLVEGAHQQLCCADGHGVAHCQHELHT